MLYSSKLTYLTLERLPSFIGLYCGNICYVFFIQSAVFAVIGWVAFLPSTTPLAIYAAFVAPVVVESAIKTLMWRKIISYEDGIRHPRLYTLADTFFSVTGVVTGNDARKKEGPQGKTGVSSETVPFFSETAPFIGGGNESPQGEGGRRSFARLKR